MKFLEHIPRLLEKRTLIKSFLMDKRADVFFDESFVIQFLRVQNVDRGFAMKLKFDGCLDT